GIGTLGVDIWLWWIDTGLHYYCGLSGILNTLLVVGLVQLWHDTRHPLVWFIGLGAVAKFLLEISSGQALLTQTLWPSVPEVHAVGFLTGVMLAILITTSSNIHLAKRVSTQCLNFKSGASNSPMLSNASDCQN
ncbi:MAG: hypothetical protein KZQ77_16680, partial [Candidatus Thiodiazotropha sp. (ex Notomyrtea botanica)]|nr:hypothetical protein [Candidatus Thiodiazotropha sp. (ex Notomyrtea botanica)]